MLRILVILCSFLTFSELYAQAWVQETYDELIESQGNSRREYPTLKITDSKEFIARFSSRTNTIFLEKEVISFIEKELANRKEDAIAYILAHELGHYKYDHGWLRRTGERFASRKAIRKLYEIGISRDRYLADEAEADAYAGLITVLSGFESIDIADDLLRGLYREYGIPEDVEGYLSLDERLELLSTVDDYVHRMLPIYWAGNYSLLVGNYTASISCFKNLLTRRLGNAEIYNNLGLAYLMKAIRRLDVYDFSAFLLPLVEPEHYRISEVYFESEQGTDYLLSEANLAFEASIGLNKSNFTSYYNNVVALDLLFQVSGDTTYLEDAEYWLRKAKRLQKGSPKQLGFLNRLIEDKENSFLENKEKSYSSTDSYSIDQYLKATVEGKIRFNRTVDLDEYYLDVLTYPNSIYYRLRPVSVMRGKTAVMYEANNSYRQPSPGGISINMDVAQLVSEFGEPEERITDGPNTYYGYETRNILFRLRDNKITGWINYKTINAH